jgi:hypothetical protein
MFERIFPADPQALLRAMLVLTNNKSLNFTPQQL